MAQIPTPLATSVASRVSAQIEAAGVTEVWLCDKTGVPRSTMRRRLAGHSAFNLNELDRIAAALRVPVSVFLTDADRAAS